MELNREEIIKSLECCEQSNCKECPSRGNCHELHSYALALIRELAETDAIEVVRCKDCEWWTKQKDSAQGRCALLSIYPTGAWYCGNGRRTEDDSTRT